MGVDAGGWPSNVAANELIESAWGNAVVKGLLGAHLASGFATKAPSIQASPGSVLFVPGPANVPYQTRMVIAATVWVASDSAAVTGITAQCLTGVSGISGVGTPTVATTGGGAYGPCTVHFSWLVPANTAAQYQLNASWGAAGGAIYTACDTTWNRYRA